MNRLTWLACAAAGLAFSQGVMAQSASREGQWETRLGVVFQNSAGMDFKGGTTADVESGTGFKLGLAYHLTDNLEIGGVYAYDQRDYTAKIVGAGDAAGEIWNAKGELESSNLMFDATYNFMSGPFSPFVEAGLGWSWVDTNIAEGPPEVGCWWDPWWGYVCADFQDTRTIDGFAYQVGVGARYDFNSQFSLSGSYRMTWVDFDNADGTPDFDAFDLTLGWKF